MNRDRLPDIDSARVAYQQILEKDHSVFSIQWLIIPAGISQGLTSAVLLQLYLDYVERFTFSLIRPTRDDAGICFRLLGFRQALISFSRPVTENGAAGERTVLRIDGGLLVQPHDCARGQLDFMVEPVPAGSRVTLRLSDYCPLLLGSSRPSLVRKWLYRLTQAYLHRVVTVRFLAMVYRQITGRKLKKETVRIEVRNGTIT